MQPPTGDGGDGHRDHRQRNIDRVTEYTRRFILTEKPFVLDLAGEFVTRHIRFAAVHLDEGCFDAGVEWSLIASQAVLEALRIGDRASFPMAPSVPEALHQFAETIDQRRRLLPLLTKKSA